jgi:hypothetical protein
MKGVNKMNKMNKRIVTLIVSAGIMLTTFVGCASKNTSVQANFNQSSPQQTLMEQKMSKPSKDDIIGGWHMTVNGILNTQASFTILFDNNKEHMYSAMDNNGVVTTGLYEIEDSGENSYKIHCYKMIVRADSNNGGGVSKGAEISTFFVTLKDKNTIQLAASGDSTILELQRINIDMAKNMILGNN